MDSFTSQHSSIAQSCSGVRIWYQRFHFYCRYSLSRTYWHDDGNQPILGKLPDELTLHKLMLVKNTLRVAIAVALVSCGQAEGNLVAYDCEGSGILISDKELRWNNMTFHFQKDVGVFRIYSEKLSEVHFNRALSILFWRNSKTSQTIVSLNCVRK